MWYDNIAERRYPDGTDKTDNQNKHKPFLFGMQPKHRRRNYCAQHYMCRMKSRKQRMPAHTADIPEHQHKSDTQHRTKKCKRRMPLQLHENMFRSFFY